MRAATGRRHAPVRGADRIERWSLVLADLLVASVVSWCEVAAQINRALAKKRRVIAVGATVMRTPESLAVHNEPKAPIRPQTAWTDLYIYPGFRFKVVDVLLTNLHRPRSSHIVLTAGFAGKDFVMRSYAEILEKDGYEFDMFGDSMLIL
ncbi:MAG TPA: S-adenosylmethionine:tRNA ribosyltransferase-isomerase [Pseudonocardiaceae bacterium]|jgi:S-adenosylmethionine:tRNA ribosyltransferase-isomerase|nr:S-adenosylmethionine:tRNA ribosyltransferase-isomerase [Pseudonocardiaceae bacterium]